MAERVKWHGSAKRDFCAWLHREVHNTIGDRAELEQKWADEVVQCRARVVGQGTCDVPFVGAADIELPLTAMHVDPVYSDFMQTLHIPSDFWSVVGKRPDTVITATPVQEFLGLIERNYIRMREVNERALLDCIVHGTAIYKDRIHHSVRSDRQRTAGGQVLKTSLVEFCPKVEHVPLQDFFIPARSTSIDPDAPVGPARWVAQRFYLTAEQLRLRATAEAPFQPEYDPDAVTEVLRNERDGVDDIVRETLHREQLYQPFEDRKITLYEVWVRFPTQPGGMDEDIVAVWHQETSTVLRATFNPFQHGHRPFEAATYFPSAGFYGVGIAEMDEWAQLASSRILNDVLNNAHLANAVMLGVPSGTNVKPDEPIYSGKIWKLAPDEQIQAIQMGRPYPGMMQMLQMFGQWSEQRTGMTDLRQGDIGSLPSRTPASTVMSVMSEGKKRFDMILGRLREGALGRIGQRVLQNLVQISQTDPRWKLLAEQALGPEDGAAVVDLLSGPVHEIEAQFGFAVSATSSQVNREVEKQGLTLLGQLMGQLYQQQFQWAQMKMQLGMQMGDPSGLMSVMAVADAALMGTSELQRRVLEAHDVQNPDQYTPKLPPAVAPGAAPMAPGAPAMGMGAPGAAQGAAVPPAAPPGPLASAGPEILTLLGAI